MMKKKNSVLKVYFSSNCLCGSLCFDGTSHCCYCKPEDAEAASSVTIGGKTYSADGTHMVVLEVVPDESYDVLGSLVADNQGVVKWTDIVKDQPKVGTVNFDEYNNPATEADKTKNDKFTQYIKDYAHKYLSSINSTLGGKVAKAYFRIKDTDKLYSVMDSDSTIARQIGYDLNNLQLEFYTVDASGNAGELIKDSSTNKPIRDIFLILYLIVLR